VLESDQRVSQAGKLVVILADAPLRSPAVIGDPSPRGAALAVATVQDDGDTVVARERPAQVLVPSRLVSAYDEE
jgi:hypothetical protein